MKKHIQPLTPAALYARVSSDRGRTWTWTCPPTKLDDRQNDL